MTQGSDMLETMKSLVRKGRAQIPTSPVMVGWAIQQDKSSIIWDAPRPYLRKLPAPASAKSVQLCPAAIDFDSRHFVVDCPVDLHLRFKVDEQRKPVIVNVPGAQGSIRSKHLGNMVHVVAQNEWRHPERPIIQVSTPYIFITDAPVYVNQLPAYLDYHDPPLPGVLIGGRFPADVWPRHLMWAFEWFDVSKDIVIPRGRPWFYVRFEGPDPARPVRLVEADIKPEVQQYIDSIAAVTNYVNRTFSLFDRARSRRPKQLLYPKSR
jgi:hypothetical protein